MERLDLRRVACALVEILHSKRCLGRESGMWWVFKLAGYFVEISVFRKQGKRLCCLPKT